MIEWLRKLWCKWDINHWPDDSIHLEHMGITPKARCRMCGCKIGLDSQGNWYSTLAQD